MSYYKTKIPGISISKTGSVKNTKRDEILKVSKRGYFTFKNTSISLPKLMIETFKKIPMKTGQIKYIDGNNQNFNIENLEYKTKLDKIDPPLENDIIEILKYYYGSKETFNLKDVFKYRMHLKIVLDQRNFFIKYKHLPNISIFRAYFSFNMPGYRNLSILHNITVRDAQRTVYFYLNKLIEDCKADKILKQ